MRHRQEVLLVIRYLPYSLIKKEDEELWAEGGRQEEPLEVYDPKRARQDRYRPQGHEER